MASRTRRLLCLRVVVPALVVGLLAGACTSGDDEPPTTSSSPTGAQAGASAGGAAPAEPNRLVGLRLTEGVGTPAEPVPVVDGEPLVDPRVGEIIDRLPAWDPSRDLTARFAWPAQTLTPPAGGTVVEQPFPPAATGTPPAEPVDTGPLTVLRSQPQGEVAVAPFVGITFSQPMVPIGTVGQLDEVDVPATISPAVPGHWEWIGTSTLRFVGDDDRFDRLPMATQYTVTVPAGTTAVSGASLAEPVEFTFGTPPLTLQQFTPEGDSVALQPVFVAVFDQQIDPAAVLGTLTLTADGTEVAVSAATQAQIDADTLAAAAVSGVPAGRVLAFRPEQPLPADTGYRVSFAAGTPSAEGPVPTPDEITRTGTTFGPLELTGADCSGDRCDPGSTIRLSFTNEVDAESFDPTSVTVDPALPGLVAHVSGREILLSGGTAPMTTYTVTVPAALADVHGQSLGADDSTTVDIGPGRPRLQQFPTMLTTLDPLVDTSTVTVHSAGLSELRLRVFAVEPSRWTAYQEFLQNTLWAVEPGTSPTAPDWAVLSDEVLTVDPADGRSIGTTVDLADELEQSKHLVVLVEPADGQTLSDEDRWQNQPTATWVQSTALGVDAWSDPQQLLIWSTDLRTGTPLAGVEVTPLGGQAPVVTDAEGRATLDLRLGVAAVIAEHDGDVALLPADQWMSSWQPAPLRTELRWYVDDDRQTYRPGETVSLKGWIRAVDASAQLAALPDGAAVDWIARDGMGTELAKGTAEVGRLGGFDLTVELPDGAALGSGSVELTLTGGPSTDNNWYGHSFQIADFRTPDFEVEVGAATAQARIAGGPFTLDAGVSYYAGGPLGAAPVAWQVRTAPASYSPPGWDDYTFGLWTPWWSHAGFDSVDTGYWPGGPGAPEAVVTEFSGVTDALGVHHLQVEVGDLGQEYDGLPATVTAQATVTDVNRQALSGSTDVVVHPAAFYVGLSSPTTFVRQGEPLTVGAVVTDIDGAAVAGREVTVRAARVTTRWVNGMPEETESPDGVQECTVTSATEAVTCTFQPEVGGTLHVTAIVADDDGRSSRSRLTRWVGGTTQTETRFVEQEVLTLIPDKAAYGPGETATVLVQSPIVTGTGMLTLSRVGLSSSRTFPVVDGTAVLEIPVADLDIPTVTLGVEVVGASPRTGPDGQPLTEAPSRPAFAAGELALEISTTTRELDVTVTPRAANVVPGGSTTIDVAVRDSAGEPVSGSEFQLVVVDEAVLAVGGAVAADPMEVFYAAVPSSLRPVFGRGSIALGQVPEVGGVPTGDADMTTSEAAAESASGGAEGYHLADGDQAVATSAPTAARDSAGPIVDRTNFTPLAVFEPSVVTDADGTAAVDVTVPDNLTRYRVLVVAVDGVDRFGSAEATLTAGLPLTVRPTAPRFLHFGDTFTLPVIVQNTGSAERSVEVVLQTDNLDVTGTAGANRTGRQVLVPAGDRVEVHFDLSASEVGTGRLRVAVVGGEDADAATVDLPVYTPATSESFAGYGIVDGGTVIRQPVLGPVGVIEQFGGLEISTSSTALATLTDAVLYLTDYEYENADGLAAQVLAIATLGEILPAFDVPGIPGEAELRATVADKVDRLVALQNDDGGFPFWERGRDSEPFNSVRVTQALAVAKTAGYPVPQETLSRATAYLVDIRAHLPSTMSEADRDTVEASALGARAEAGDPDVSRANTLVTDRGEVLPLDALAWLWPIVDDPAAAAFIADRVQAAAVDTAGAVTFTESIDDGDWTLLRSDRRTDALVLDALVREQPASDLVPKAVAGLLAAQGSRGRWATAQENTFALVALKRYYDTFEATPADFVSRVWLGERFAAEHAFVGHTDEIAALEIPTSDLVATGDTAVTIANDGTGRLYYRMGLRTAPADIDRAPLGRGFVVQRTYEAVDDPADVVREADGTWTIRAGAVVRVRVDLVARSDRTGAALIDPLPAGLEILNPELATTPIDLSGDSTQEPRPLVDGWWYGTWFDHQNLRDDRAEAYASTLAAGDYSYTYLARATTPGSFVAPPARAEEIYAPETFGRSGTDRVVVR